MKKIIQIFILALLIFIAFQGHSQTLLHGEVRDQKGNPVSYATVYIDKTLDGTTTDSTGNFSLKTSEKGKKLLVISCIGYQTLNDTVVLDKKEISLSPRIKSNQLLSTKWNNGALLKQATRG